MEWRGRERMKVATARHGMHRNGRSSRKHTSVYVGYGILNNNVSISTKV